MATLAYLSVCCTLAGMLEAIYCLEPLRNGCTTDLAASV